MKGGGETPSSLRTCKQARLLIHLEGRAGQVVGEGKGREKPEGVGTKGLLKGARGYLQKRADLCHVSKTIERK